MSEDPSLRTKVAALYSVASFRPAVTAGIVGLSVIVAGLEGLGLGFILPIIEVTQGNAQARGGAVGVFARGYGLIGIPFTLEYIILGVGLVIGIRYGATFIVGWLTARLKAEYTRHLRTMAFQQALGARIQYFEATGSDEMLNAIITQTDHASDTIRRVRRILELVLVSLAYLLLAFVLAPVLLIATVVVLGGFMLGIRRILASGYQVGSQVATANERVQSAVQDSMQGIREVKLFHLQPEVFDVFRGALDQWVTSHVHKRRNQELIRNFNQFITAATVFVLIYFGLEVMALSLGALGVFLFAMFRLGPKSSHLNDHVYRLENDLPHLVRTQSFIDSLAGQQEPEDGKPVSGPIETITFDDVDFAYESNDRVVLDGVSLTVEAGTFIGIAGPSGAGKSTIASLLARLHDVDGGHIRADGAPIDTFRIDQWRDQIALVGQDPFIFNETLRYNLTIGNRDVSQEEIDRVCDIACVDAFLEELPAGYETVLGEDGVRLSGGQRQRVAIARALLKEADFLILDEATSDLDSHLEAAVHRGIQAMDRDYGLIAIAHRLSTITDADRIYVMEAGRVVEAGDHHSLLEADGTYAALYEQQVGEIN